jgi:hypothetical protein
MTNNRVYKAAIGVIALIIVISGLTMAFGGFFKGKHDTIVVTGKNTLCDIGPNDSTTCQYLVFTPKGTYVLDQSMGGWNMSMDKKFGQVVPCHKYAIKYYGWRAEFFSNYPSIVKMTDLGTTENCR